MPQVSRVRVFFFLALGGIFFVASHAYLLRRFARRWLHRPRHRWIVASALTLALVAVMSMRRVGVEAPLGDALSWVAYLWMGTGLFLLLAALLLDSLEFFRRFRTTKAPHAGDLKDPGRRALWSSPGEAVALGAACAGAGVGLWQARGPFEITQTEIVLENLPASFDGYRIVQVSDIHVGPTIKRGFVERIVERINELEADLVAVTGDLVDGSLDYLSEEVAALGAVNSKDGAFFVTGNHEYYSGASQWVRYLESIGISPLMNEHRVIQRGADALIVAGVTDYSAHRYEESHRSDVERALRGVHPQQCKLLLAHQPRSVFDAAKAGVDLQISGHTHNGQMFPFNFFVAMAQPYMKGLARVVESKRPMWIYVHRGTGYWGPPNRLGIAPEVAVLTLRSAEKANAPGA